MFYVILILFLTIYYFWVIHARKSKANVDSAEQAAEEIIETEPKQVQLVETETTYLNEDNESFDSLSYEVELGFRFKIIIQFTFYWRLN